MKHTNVIVTGACGFIGSHLVELLKSQGYKVIPIPHKELEDRISLTGKIHRIKPDCIFHLAAYGNMAHHQRGDMIIQANITNLYNLLFASKDIDYKAFVNVSSSSVTLKHQTLYSATKMGGEELCKAFVDEYDKNIMTVRPYSVYGFGEADFRFIPTVFRSCLKGERMQLVVHPVHDWIYVDDIAAMLLTAAIAGNKNEIYLAGTGIGTSNIEIVKKIENITGKKANYEITRSIRPYDSINWVASKVELEPLVQIDQGLQKMYDHLKTT